jgi:hypothetical protein
MPFSKVSDLPASLQAALRRVGYCRADVQVVPRETESPFSGGGQGYRAFCIVVDLATGESAETWGSWGGSNMFAPTNLVDTCTESFPIPTGKAVVTGQIGGDRPVSATIALHPSNVVPWLPPAASELTDEEKQILAAFRSLTPAGRKDSLRGKERQIDRLVELGYLKRNKAGATALSLLGKNAAEGVRLSW